jgi:hypothetical protein
MITADPEAKLIPGQYGALKDFVELSPSYVRCMGGRIPSPGDEIMKGMKFVTPPFEQGVHPHLELQFSNLVTRARSL